MKLTKHYSLEDFLVSSKFPLLAKLLKPGYEEKNNLFLLSTFAIEPATQVFGPITILSGFRSKELNQAVNGSTTSQHLRGLAADCSILGNGFVSKDLYLWVTEVLKWTGEVIFYPNHHFVHIALPELGVKADRFIKEG